jgi:hypothetical protein
VNSSTFNATNLPTTAQARSNSARLSGANTTHRAGSEDRLEHVLRFFIEAGHNGIMIAKSKNQSRQRRPIEIPPHHLSIGRRPHPRQVVESMQSADPGTIPAVRMRSEEPSSSNHPLCVERLLDAGWQRFLDFGKFVFVGVGGAVFADVLAQLFLLHQRVVVIVNPHHAIERMNE